MKLDIYTKTTCGYCHLLKKQLKKNDIEYNEINIEHDPEAEKFIKEAGHTTVPQLYHNGDLFVVGGYDGFMEYLEEQQKHKDTQSALDSLGGI